MPAESESSIDQGALEQRSGSVQPSEQKVQTQTPVATAISADGKKIVRYLTGVIRANDSMVLGEWKLGGEETIAWDGDHFQNVLSSKLSGRRIETIDLAPHTCTSGVLNELLAVLYVNTNEEAGLKSLSF